ncbi:unnamed protein product [Adineta steineri]|uniref:Complexin n=1 Tax=Adineta steineri TaxID=433720 RepID=A0A815ACM5_9BILA|nr:unnamed protein product [Adineta steineri]CAF3993411.1 unnamed protein product [Adineta steineri]
MSSYLMKMAIGNEIDKAVNGIFGSNETEENEDNGMSGEDLIAEQNRQAANERERQVRHSKIEKEREDARQKIRDKYNIKKKDDIPTKTKNQQQGKVDDLITRVHDTNVKIEKINGPTKSQGTFYFDKD